MKVNGNLIALLKNHFVSLFFIVSLSLLMSRNYLFSNSFPTGTDMLGWISRTSMYTANMGSFYIWDIQSFGSVRRFSFETVLTVFNYFIKDPVLTIKITIFFILVFSGFNMYYFTYYFTKRKVASIFAATVYMISQYQIGQLASGHLNIAVAYVVTPLLFITFKNTLESGKLKSIILFAALATTTTIFIRTDVFAYSLPFLFLFLLFVILIPFNGIGRKTILVNFMKTILLSIPLIILFGASQFLPDFMGVNAPYLSLRFPTEQIKEYSLPLYGSLLGIAREVGNMGYVGGIWWSSHPFLSQPQYRLAMSFLVVISFLAIFIKKERIVMFFVIISLISIFFAKGPHPPLGNIYEWIFSNVPFAGLLRIPNRWLMITYFSYAFLGGITVDYIYHKLKEMKFSTSSLKIISKSLSKIFLILSFIIISLGSSFVVTHGLQVWDVPEQEIRPHLWIAEKLGDFKVVTVPFWQGWMRIGEDKGNDHDIGYESSLYNGKRVIGTGGWDQNSRDFVYYIRGLTLNNRTDKTMPILGTIGVKYLVLQGYYPTSSLPRDMPPTFDHDFFMKQDGLIEVYNFKNATVYENQYWTPHIFASSKSAIVVGGREALTALAEIDEFNFSNWALFFADQVIRENGEETYVKLVNKSDALIFVNSEPLDFAMLMLDNATRIKAAQYAYPSINSKEHWIGDDSTTKEGMFVLNSKTLSTSGENSVSIPVELKKDGNYEVWTRVSYHKDRGELRLSIDGKEIGSIIPYSSAPTIKWIKVGEVALERGKHSLRLKNKRTVYGIKNEVDEIIIVRSGDVENVLNKTIWLLQNYNGEIVYFIDEATFSSAKFGKMAKIADDDQTKFWRNVNPEHVELSDSLDVPMNSKNSLRINIKPNRGYSTLIEKKFVRLEDWSKDREVSFWFKGSDTGSGFEFSIFFDNSYNNWAKFSFVDASSNWEKVKFDTNRPDSTNGSVDWSKVWLVRISNSDKKMTGTVYIDNLQRFSLEEREVNISVLKEEMYEIALKARGNGEVTVKLGDISKTLEIDEISNKWFTVGSYSLKNGRYNIRINISGNVKVEQIRVSPVNTILLNTGTPNLKVNFTKINPTKYMVNLETNDPVFLVFSDSYHPLWRAYVTGREYKSIIAYSFINSFYIPETSENTVIIEFIGQRYVWIGMIISIISLIFAASYLFYDWRVNKGDRWANTIRNRIENIHKKIFNRFGVFYVSLRKR